MVGWIALFVLTVIIERPILGLAARTLGASWVPTVQVILGCLGLFVIGWTIGRWGRAGVLLFTATIAIWNFRLVPEIDLLWLGRLLIDCFESSRYLESFVTSLATHVFVFSSLFAGAAANRGHERTVLHIK